MGVKESINSLRHSLSPHQSPSSEHAPNENDHEVPSLLPQHPHSHKPHRQNKTPPDDRDEGKYRRMSEVAAPGPAEKRHPEEESSRRPSLEQMYSNSASRHSGHHQEDRSGSLSELAAPEPVGRGRDSDDESGSESKGRKDSLESRLSGSSG